MAVIYVTCTNGGKDVFPVAGGETDALAGELAAGPEIRAA